LPRPTTSSSAPRFCRCFCYSYGDHRDLHSFPTRRSSDLNGDGPLVLETVGRLPPVMLREFLHPPREDERGKQGILVAVVNGQRRSEEHTSELQSLTNLVCRLLLEKKKTRHSTKRSLNASP